MTISSVLSIKTPSMKEHIGNLSGGNQQKVIISRWLAKDPDILIMDEPTRGIDIGAKHEIYEIMEELAKQGKAIIMIFFRNAGASGYGGPYLRNV